MSKYNFEDLSEGVKCFIFVVSVALIAWMMLSLGGCTSAPPKPDPKACVINNADKMCWFNKSTGDGTSLPLPDGWFALDPDDMTNVLVRCPE